MRKVAYRADAAQRNYLIDSCLRILHGGQRRISRLTMALNLWMSLQPQWQQPR